MLLDVRATRRPGIRRWMTAVALIAGLVGMHHLMAAPMAGTHATAMHLGSPAAIEPAAPDSVPAAAAAAAPGAGAMDAMMHLCLAVLIGLIVLGLPAVAAVMTGRERIGVAPAVVTTEARPPPPTAVRLARLCVLRN